MKRAPLNVLVLLLMTVVVARSEDVAVLVDVSGSMAHYGAWQADAAILVKNILAKGDARDQMENWSTSGDTAIAKQFQLAFGEHIKLIKFGNVHPGVSTFFPVQAIDNVEELSKSFPSASEFRDAHTNKELATAVAVKTVHSSQSIARVISISDFLSDADLSIQEQEYVNSAMQGTSVENNLVFSWKRNPRVMLRLQKINVPGDGMAKPQVSGEKGTLELIPARLDPQSASLHLAWRCTGPKPLGFDVKVSSNAGDILLSKTNLITSEILLKDPPGGEIKWTVSARYAGGGITTASRQEMLPQNGKPGLIIAILILGLLTVAGFFLLRKHSDSMLASMKKVFGRSTDSGL